MRQRPASDRTVESHFIEKSYDSSLAKFAPPVIRLHAYEEFYDEYCDLMAQYTKNPTDFSLLTKYGNMLSKMTEIDAAFKKWNDADMTTAEAAYYLEVNSRVLQKLAKVMG